MFKLNLYGWVKYIRKINITRYTFLVILNFINITELSIVKHSVCDMVRENINLNKNTFLQNVQMSRNCEKKSTRKQIL